MGIRALSVVLEGDERNGWDGEMADIAAVYGGVRRD